MEPNNWQTHFFSWLRGVLVGTDADGNRYYQEKCRKKSTAHSGKRWVLYAHDVEASRVPAVWWGWLHYRCDAPLPQEPLYEWVASHQENATGTPQAYYPPRQGGNPQLAKNGLKRYEPWQPPTK